MFNLVSLSSGPLGSHGPGGGPLHSILTAFAFSTLAPRPLQSQCQKPWGTCRTGAWGSPTSCRPSRLNSPSKSLSL